MIEFMEKSKSLNETIDFNKDNIFDYIFFIHHNLNAHPVQLPSFPE